MNGFVIPLPPLRDRIEDIPLLLEYYFRRAKHDMSRKDLAGLSPKAFDLLQQYDWPGNVRQLQSVVRQSVLNSTGTVIDAVNLPSFLREKESASTESFQFLQGLCYTASEIQLSHFIDHRVKLGTVNLYAEALERMERQLFARVLDLANGNQSRTAEILGITRGKVRDRIATFGIQVEKTISMSEPESKATSNPTRK